MKSSKTRTLLDDVKGVFDAPNKRAFCTTAVRDTSAKRFIAIVDCRRLIDDNRKTTATNKLSILCTGK
jgi:hypothetical protein